MDGGSAMPSWGEVEAEAPELAALARGFLMLTSSIP